MQGPWTFFANLDLYDGDSMRRLAKYFHYRFNSIDARNDADMHELSPVEMREMSRMFDESVGNTLLTDMLVWYSSFKDGHYRQLLYRAQELAENVNNTVRLPKLYPEDYAKEVSLWDRKTKARWDSED